MCIAESVMNISSYVENYVMNVEKTIIFLNRMNLNFISIIFIEKKCDRI